MTIPIKPPGQPSSSSATSASEAVEANATAAASASKAAVDAIVEMAASVRAGKVDASAAVEQLLQRVIDQTAASGLAPARRAELETLLRDALTTDPTLSALVDDLSRD